MIKKRNYAKKIELNLKISVDSFTKKIIWNRISSAPT